MRSGMLERWFRPQILTKLRISCSVSWSRSVAVQIPVLCLFTAKNLVSVLVDYRMDLFDLSEFHPDLFTACYFIKLLTLRLKRESSLNSICSYLLPSTTNWCEHSLTFAQSINFSILSTFQVCADSDPGGVVAVLAFLNYRLYRFHNVHVHVNWGVNV